ncbi:MAG: hypothetical protein ACRC0B_08715 [Legionella sp.]
MKVIMDHVDDFVQILLSIIANESEAGQKNVLTILAKAERRYQAPVESWITGWVYGYTRVKGDKIHQSQDVMTRFSDAYTRIQEFKLLLEDKHWGAFNLYFFDELVKSIAGYEPLTEDERSPVLKRIKTLMLEKFDGFMTEYTVTQEQVARRKEEQQVIEQKALLQINKEILCSSLACAQKSVQDRAESIHFCLVLKDKYWQLHWVDFTGKAHPLELTEELCTLLAKHKITSVDTISPIQAKSIKRECVAARAEFFKKAAQTYINPMTAQGNTVLSDEQLKESAIRGAFIIRGASAPYVLSWISLVGHVNTINLTLYPEFNSWLNQQTTFGELELERLKTYLLYVNTSKALGMEDFKEKLANCLTGVRPEVEEKENTSKPLNMAAFSHLEALFGDDQFKAKARQNQQQQAEPGALNLEQFSAITSLFGHRPRFKEEGEEKQVAYRL